MGIPRDLLNHGICVQTSQQSTPVRGVFTPITTHTQPIPIHFYVFRRSQGDILGDVVPVSRSEE